MNYLLALDQGTSSSRALVFDDSGCLRGSAQREFAQHFPRPGWVEHDALEIWTTQLLVAREALMHAGAPPEAVAGIGIANQRETLVVWDRASGEPIHRAIVWQDRRTAEACEALRAAGRETVIRDRCGLVADAYFSATKLQWILENVPGAVDAARAGRLAFGTIDSWLIWNLTGGAVHATDHTNASRTMLYDIRCGCWDEELAEWFRIPRSMLPEIVPSSGIIGYTSPQLFGSGIPISGVAGDQQAALFGHGCTRPGTLKNTYGTGCFLLLCTGAAAVTSENRLLTTVACDDTNRPAYALEGSVFVAGAAVQWLRDGLGLIASSGDVEPLARTVPDNGDVYLVPAFTGLGAPHWDAYARGAIVGITRGTTAGHIARATLESIAYQTADVVDAMRRDSGIPVTEVRVDGGATSNDLLMQFQADVLGVPVVRPAMQEMTAIGAARLAGLGCGLWQPGELPAHGPDDRTFEPGMPEERRLQLLTCWRQAVGRATGWAPRGA